MILARSRGHRRVIYFLSAFSLAAGTGIYILFRPGTFVFHRWLHFLGLEEIVNNRNSVAGELADHLPGWLLAWQGLVPG